jgi:tetratricopeptide (TPR) repeat protein
MSTIGGRLALWEARIGQEFAASVAPGGSLRLWMVKHLVGETGEAEQTVETAIDGWLERTHQDGPDAGTQSPSSLDDRIEILIEQRRQISPADDAVETAYLDSEIGAALTDAGRPFEALSRFMAARDAFERNDGWLDAGVCDMEMGLVATHLGWYDVAGASFQRARRVIGQYGTLGDFARLLVGQANLAKASDLTEDSVDLLQRARWLSFEAGESRIFAVATHNLANNASSDGEFEIAIDLFGQARRMHEDLGDRVAVADCDKNAASALIDNGEYEKGLELAKKALDVYVEHGQPIETAHARRTIAHALDHLAEHAEAVRELEQARDLYVTADRLPSVAACDIDLSYALRSLGRFDDAAAAIHAAQDAYREVGKDADDPWFAETLDAIARGTTDSHEHPIVVGDGPDDG